MWKVKEERIEAEGKEKVKACADKEKFASNMTLLDLVKARDKQNGPRDVQESRGEIILTGKRLSRWMVRKDKRLSRRTILLLLLLLVRLFRCPGQLLG